MRNLVLTALLAFASINAHAGTWDVISGAFKDTVTPTKEYAVATSGNNLRVYEWPMQTDKRFVIVYTVGESGTGTSQIVKIK